MPVIISETRDDVVACGNDDVIVCVNDKGYLGHNVLLLEPWDDDGPIEAGVFWANLATGQVLIHDDRDGHRHVVSEYRKRLHLPVGGRPIE